MSDGPRSEGVEKRIQMAGEAVEGWQRTNRQENHVSSLPSLCSNNTKQFSLTFLEMWRAELAELRMPHSIIAKEIKVPLIAFGQLLQFFLFCN